MVRYAEHTLDIDATLTLDHTCRSCRSTFMAHVAARGAGTSLGGSSAGPTAAQQRSLESQALSSLEPDARESIALVPCPRCNKRQLGRLVPYALRAFLLTGLIGIAVGIFAAVGLHELGLVELGNGFNGSIRPGRLVTFALPIGLVVTLASEVAFIAARMSRAHKSVSFDPHP